MAMRRFCGWLGLFSKSRAGTVRMPQNGMDAWAEGAERGGSERQREERRG